MNEAVAEGQSPEVRPEGAGAMLMAERRRQGLSLGDISRQLKLSVRQIEALERDDFKSFRGAVFVHGFIRNYAKLLRLDAEHLIRAADLALAPPAVAQEQSEPDASGIGGKPPARNRSAIVAAVLVMILVGTAIYFGNRGGDGTTSPPHAAGGSGEPSFGNTEPKSPPEIAAAAPDAVRPAAALPATASAGRATLRMIFDQESWVEIKDSQGNVIFGQLTPAGSRRSVSGEPPLTVVVGNAVGVRISYRDQSVDLAPHTQVNVARLTLE